MKYKQESKNTIPCSNEKKDNKRIIKIKEFAIKIGFPTSSGVVFKPLSEILFFEADGGYTKVYFEIGKSIIVSKPIGSFEKSLQGQPFVRIHQSHIINLKFLKSFSRGKTWYILLENGKELRVSASRRAQFEYVLGYYFIQ